MKKGVKQHYNTNIMITKYRVHITLFLPYHDTSKYFGYIIEIKVKMLLRSFLDLLARDLEKWS